jgi:hypothetical protein
LTVSYVSLLFQVHQTFRLGFISGFGIKSGLYCFKVGKTAAETHMMREAYGVDASSQTTTYE